MISDGTVFPILWPWKRTECAALERLGCPRAVPWALVVPHEAQARRNHGGQSLERLAERGGLSPDELVAVLEDRPWRLVPLEAAVQALRARLS